MSIGLGDRLYSSYSVVALNTKRSLILSIGKKLINGLCVEFLKIVPGVESLGFIVKG